MEFAVDTGNKQIKTKNFVFMSDILPFDTVPSTASIEDYMKYNGKYYVLSNKRAEYMRDKSESERYFLLTLLGIVKELDKENDYKKDKVYNVKLLVGLPPAHMENAKLKKNFSTYFKTQEPVKVTYKGRVWTVKISRVHVYAQCYAAMMTMYAKIKDFPRVLGIDIGGFTSDYMMLERGRIDIDNTDSMENGVISLYREVKKECLKKYDAVIEEADVDEILSGSREFYYDNELIETVEEIAERFVDKFLANFREIGIDLKRCRVVFMGGGSVLLKKYLEKSPMLNKPLFIDDIHANVKGYEMLYKLSQRRVG